MADPDDDDPDQLVLDAGDDTVVADTVFPVSAEHRPMKGFADGARVIERGKAFMQEFQDTARIFVTELLQVALGVPVKLNRPGHRFS